MRSERVKRIPGWVQKNFGQIPKYVSVINQTILGRLGMARGIREEKRGKKGG